MGVRKQVHRKDHLDRHNLQLWDGSSTDAKETNPFFLSLFSNQCLQLKKVFWDRKRFYCHYPILFSKALKIRIHKNSNFANWFALG
jgi:hypothetical protein